MWCPQPCPLPWVGCYICFTNEVKRLFTLLPYQQRALDAVQTNRKGSVFVPTGGGKTVIMMEDAKQRIARASKPLTF